MLAAAETVVAAQIEHRQADTNIADGLPLAAQAVRGAAHAALAERALERAGEAMALRTTRALTGAYERLAGVLAALRGEHDQAIGHFAARSPRRAASATRSGLSSCCSTTPTPSARTAVPPRPPRSSPRLADPRATRAVRLIPAVEALEGQLPQEAAA